MLPGSPSPALLQAAQHQAIRHRPGQLSPVCQVGAVQGPQPVQGRSLAGQAAHQAGQQLREALRQLLPFQPAAMPAPGWSAGLRDARNLVAGLQQACSWHTLQDKGQDRDGC